MKNLFAKILFIFVCSLVILSCSSTKHLTENEFLLNRVNVFVNNEESTDEKMMKQVYQFPNGKLFTVPLQLQLYNLGNPYARGDYHRWLVKHPKTKNSLNYILSEKQVNRLAESFFVSGVHDMVRSLGEPPSLYNHNKTTGSKIRLKNYFFNKGYFDVDVSSVTDTVYKDKKVAVDYRIITGSPYLLDTIKPIISTLDLETIYKKHQSKSLLRSNNQYDLSILDAERDRITKLFRNNGAFDFQKTYINFEVDTINKENKANLYTVIKNRKEMEGDTLVSKPFNLYAIKNVDIYTFVKRDSTLPVKKVTYKGIQIFYQGKLAYRPSVLYKANFIKPYQNYSDKDKSLTTRSFNSFNVFKYPSIQFTKDTLKVSDKRVSLINTKIILDPKKKFMLSPSVDVTNSNIQRVGIEANLGTTFRNVFRGAEVLDLNLRVNTGSSASKYHNDQNHFFDILEYGANVNLKFPEFVFPVNVDKVIPRTMFPETSVSLGVLSQRNIGLDKQTLNAGLNYKWYPTKRINFSLDILNLQYIQNLNPLNYFNVYRSTYQSLNYLAKNYNGSQYFLNEEGDLDISYADEFISEYLSYGRASLNYKEVRSIAERKKRLVENNLILSSNFHFTYDTQNNTKDHDFFRVSSSLETAGNILDLLISSSKSITSEENEFSESDTRGELAGVAYSQYAKAQLDLVKYFSFGEKNTLACRFFGGLAVPYGNSNSVPFSRSFFAGGSNDIRAWQSYRLGPGSSGAINDFNEANMKVTFSAEYRRNLIGPWNLAVFMDMGNIWNIWDITLDESKVFQGVSSFKDIAIGSGLGLRYDFGFFVARVDIGLKMYNPEKIQNHRWFSDLTYNKAVFNIGINHPF